MSEMTNEQLHSIWGKSHRCLMDALAETKRLSAENETMRHAIIDHLCAERGTHATRHKLSSLVE